MHGEHGWARWTRTTRSAWLLAGAWLAVYMLTASRYVQGGDNGEFATLMARGGVAHPPGFPLYVLYLRALHWLPAASPAHAAALATAWLGALTVFVLHRAAMAWGTSASAASVGAMLFGVSAGAWHASTNAEVFALNALIAACILRFAAARGPVAGWKRTALLGLLAGLGISNHHSIVLMLPVGLYGVVRGSKEDRRWMAGLGAGAVGLLLGLTPYLTIPWFARDPNAGWVWLAPDGPAGLAHHFLRTDYGTFRLAASDRPPTPGAHLVALGAYLLRDLLGLPILALTAAARGLWRVRPTRAALRRPELVLALAFALTGPVFVARFNLPLSGIALRVIERFYLLPALVCCLAVALSFDSLLPGLLRKPPMAWSLVGAIGVAGAILAYPAVHEANGPAVELYLRDTLDIAPPDAIIIGTGDHRLFGFTYAREALHIRHDVQFVDPEVPSPTYRLRIGRAARLPVPVDGPLTMTDMIRIALGSGRPVFLTDATDPRLEAQFVLWPEGTLLRVVQPGSSPPSVDQVEARNLELLDQFRFVPPSRRMIDSWAGGITWDYARPWFALADAYESLGRAQAAGRARARGLAIMPWYHQVSNAP